MRFLFVTQPALGHFHPLVPVAKMLIEQGHEAAVACAKSFQSTVEQTGLPSFPAGLDWLESEAEETFPELQEISLTEQRQDWLLTDVFADIAAQRMVPDLLSLCRTWQPDVIIRTDFEFASCIVSECLSIPQATISVETFIPVNMWESQIGDELSYLRSLHGLPPYPATDMLFPYLYLAFVAPSYQFPEFKLPPVFHSIRPHLFDRIGDETLPYWINDLPERPTIYCTLGTVYNRAPHIFRTILTALQDEPVNLIVTVGSNQDPAQFGPQPDHIHIEQYIPQSLLLPHCDLAITHGGFQTTTSVMSHALPMIAIPFGSTDPFRAIRCAELGVGKALVYDQATLDAYFQYTPWSKSMKNNPNWLPLTPETVKTAVREIVEVPEYRENAHTLYQELKALPGIEKAVSLLVELGTKAPLA